MDPHGKIVPLVLHHVMYILSLFGEQQNLQDDLRHVYANHSGGTIKRQSIFVQPRFVVIRTIQSSRAFFVKTMLQTQDLFEEQSL